MKLVIIWVYVNHIREIKSNTSIAFIICTDLVAVECRVEKVLPSTQEHPFLTAVFILFCKRTVTVMLGFHYKAPYSSQGTPIAQLHLQERYFCSTNTAPLCSGGMGSRGTTRGKLYLSHRKNNSGFMDSLNTLSWKGPSSRAHIPHEVK